MTALAAADRRSVLADAPTTTPASREGEQA